MALKEMTTVLNCEREALEFDSIPEYLTDTQLPTREAAVSMSSKLFNERELMSEQNLDRSYDKSYERAYEPKTYESDAPKSDELEALWPGVHHDFAHTPRKGPSFYLTIGFMAGAVISLGGVFGYSAVSHLVASKNTPSNANVLVADVPANKAVPPAPGVPGVAVRDGSEVFLPAAPTYKVQPGDTLAGIALRNYKRVSPRLLDEICKANNMRNANVLSLGQSLTLPEYHPAGQVASAGQVQ